MLGVGTIVGWFEVINSGFDAAWLFFITNSNSDDSLDPPLPPLPSCFGGPAPACSWILV